MNLHKTWSFHNTTTMNNIHLYLVISLILDIIIEACIETIFIIILMMMLSDVWCFLQVHGCSKAKCKTNENGTEYACESKDYFSFSQTIWKIPDGLFAKYLINITQLIFQDVLVLKVWWQLVMVDRSLWESWKLGMKLFLTKQEAWQGL